MHQLRAKIKNSIKDFMVTSLKSKDMGIIQEECKNQHIKLLHWNPNFEQVN